MTISPREHALLLALSDGPATYAQLGAVLGIQADSARRCYSRRLRDMGLARCAGLAVDLAVVLQITDEGRAALSTARVAERRGRPALPMDRVLAYVRREGSVTPRALAAALRCSASTARRRLIAGVDAGHLERVGDVWRLS